MIRPHYPRSIRSRLLLATVVSVGIALILLVLAFNLLFARRLSVNATDQARARAAAALSTIDMSGGQVEVREALDGAAADAPVWVFVDGRALEAPRTSTLNNAAARIASGNGETLDAGDYRLVALPIVAGGRRVGSVVAAVSLAPYEEAQHTGVIASVVLSVIVLIVVAFVTRWILATALRPVSSMTASARDWSEHDLDRRFELGPPHDELTELAETLDRLLDRIATALRREQRLTAEISHELRTPLARIATQSELALRRDRQPEQYRTALTTVRRNATAMTRIIDTLLTAARAAAGTHTESASATEIAQRAADAAAELARTNGVDLVVDVVDGDSLVAADVDLATRILYPLIDNACRYGRTRATITVDRDGRDVVFTIEDDGAGVDAAELDHIFLPGVRGSQATATTGAGLGLALARRLADSVGGTIEAVPGSTGDFVVRLATPT